MRISIFTDSFLPYLSGVTFVVLNQANEMVRRGHEVTIFRPRPKLWKRSFPLPEGVDPAIAVHDVPVALPTRKRPDLRIALPTFLYSLAKVRRFRPDVVHAHTEWGCGWEGLLAARTLRIPVVGTFHTFFAEPGYLRQFGLPNFRATRAAMWRFSTAFYNRCDTIICPSQETKRILMTHKMRREPFVVSNGIQQPVIKSDAEIRTLRSEYGVTGSPVFIYVGRVSMEKSMEVALQAFRLVLDKAPQAQLVIVGAGPSDKAVASETKRLGMEKAVLCTGMIDHETLIRDNIFLLGDVFVTASKTENQPLSLMEGMSFNLPLVAADAKGNPELVEHGRNGYVFEPDNPEQMAQFMQTFVDNHPEQAGRMGAESGKIIQEHLVPNVVAKLEDLYWRTIENYVPKKRRWRLRRRGRKEKNHE